MKSFSVNHLCSQLVNHLSDHPKYKKNRYCKYIVHLEGLVEIEFKLKVPSQRHNETALYILFSQQGSGGSPHDGQKRLLTKLN